MKRLIVDVDGVVANFCFAYAELLAEEAGGCKLPAGWRDDPTFPKVWNWEPEYGYDQSTIERVWKGHILKRKDFWLRLDPVPDTYYSMRRLNELAKTGKAEVYFLTHRMGNMAKAQTERWLYDRGGIDYPTVILSGEDKIPIIRDLQPDFYIDDKPSTMIHLAETAEKERWSQADYYLKSAPYNSDVVVSKYTNLKRAPSLGDALKESGLWTL